jgi:hypothetical protein
MEKIPLKNVTLLGIDCLDVERLQRALDISESEIEFGATKLLTSLPTTDPRVVPIAHLGSVEAYSEFCIKDLVNYVDTDYVLIVQYDGFVLHSQSWSADFLKYDYVGAPWFIEKEYWFTKFELPRSLKGQHVIGNGGFCLRSRRFLEASSALALENKFSKYHPEDLVLCVFDKQLLVAAGMKFAPYEIARRFSIEGSDEVLTDQFGFHGFRWTDISKWIVANPKYAVTQVLDS